MSHFQFSVREYRRLLLSVVPTLRNMSFVRAVLGERLVVVPFGAIKACFELTEAELLVSGVASAERR